MEATKRIEKPKLVILTSRFPQPLTKGDKLRIYHHIKFLAVKFRIYLICMSETIPLEQELQGFQALCERVILFEYPGFKRKFQVLTRLFGHLPLQVQYFYNRNIFDQIKTEIAWIQPNHIHVHLLRMAPYALDLDSQCGISIDFMDSMRLNDLGGQYLRHPLLKWLLVRERRLIHTFESRTASRFDDCFIISERDRAMFDPGLQHKIKILKNGVDVSYYRPNTDTVSTKYDVVFCGNLSYRPNIEAVLYILCELLKGLSGIQLFIAGADLTKENRDRFIKNFEENNSGNNTLQIEGYLEDIRSVYYSGRIMVVPIFTGSGQQNKVLEAMACGISCVTTHFVNEGIKAEADRDLLLANDQQEFISHIKNLLSHPERRNELSTAGRRFVERNYTWPVNSETLSDSIAKAIANE